MPVATNVAAGKPAVNGAIWTAPLGSILPTDALTEMTAIYALTTDTALTTGKTYNTKSGTTYTAVAEPAVANIATYYEKASYDELGYVSDDGVENENSPESDTVKAWGGDPVLTLQTEKNDTFKWKLIEVKNVGVLKTVYGDANVSGTLDSGITVNATTEEPEPRVWVVDTKLGNALKRIVIPNGKLSELGTITYKDDEPIGYEMTINAAATNGVTHHEYIVKAPAAAGESTVGNSAAGG